MSDYAVDVEALRADERRWDGWADRLKSIQDAVPREVNASVFGTVAGVAAVYQSVSRGLATLGDYVDAGRTEFRGIANALARSAEVYAANDEELSADVRRVAYRLGLS